MTVIAWDGINVAADKRAVCGNMIHTTTKLRRLPSGEILGWTGCEASGHALVAWYTDGADVTKWPECQKDDKEWGRLIVVNSRGARYFERQPFSVKVEDAFMSWGCGADFARAAMHCGKTAKEAVEIACLYDNGCGNGIDVMKITN